MIDNASKTNELGIEVTLGTVSHGTMRPQDLIPRFLDVLKDVDPGQHSAFIMTPFTAVPAYVQDEGDDSEWWASEDAQHLVNELFDALDGAAPDGVYFGAHEGDGSDYGFWPVDPCFYDEDAAVDDDVPCDLLYIAKHVMTWPDSRNEWVRLDRDGEICFGEYTTEHDFFPEGKHEGARNEHPEFLAREGGATGRRYTREEWEDAQ